jgi:RIO kinase 2
MVRNVAGEMVDLEAEDFYLLSGIEQGMRYSEWVSREKLPEFSRLTAEDVSYRIDRCEERGLLERRTIQYEGYQLAPEGYDILALRTFAERDTIKSVGAPLGVGKESDVYEVRSYKPLALKYHREGYTNFREVDKGREYTAGSQHSSWLYTARKAAEREYGVLSDLYPGVRVPRPIDQNRHAIVMAQMDGVELSRARLEPAQARPVCDLVLREIATAYDTGYVHADMSQYNVFVGEGGVTIFDWPQAVATDHANAGELLERDVENVVSYFRQKHPREVPETKTRALAHAIGEGNFESVSTFETS